jgi:hypothetical protein
MLFPDSMLDEWLIALAAFLIAIGVVVKFASTMYHTVKRIESAIGVDAQGRTLAERLGVVEHQLFPNGGSSLTDKINRIAFEQKEMKNELDAVKLQINELTSRP